MVTAETPNLQTRAQKIASDFNIPYANIAAENTDWLLVLTSERLELQQKQDKIGGPIFVDFLKGKSGYRAKQGGGQQQLIAKAVGIKSQLKPTILDVTAGLGRDAFVLANLGCKVQMLERSPIIAALLADGLERAQQDLTFKKNCSLSLIIADGLLYLSGLSELTQDDVNKPDVIYIDPMYPARSKSALVKKELRALRAIVGDDSDAAELLNKALQVTKRRVVVKRPRLAPTLNEIIPSVVYKGINTRFDVYLPTIGKSK